MCVGIAWRVKAAEEAHPAGRSGVRVLHFCNRSPRFWGGDRTEDRRPGHKGTAGPGSPAQPRAVESPRWPTRLPPRQPRFLLSPVSARWAAAWAAADSFPPAVLRSRPPPRGSPLPGNLNLPGSSAPRPPTRSSQAQSPRGQAGPQEGVDETYTAGMLVPVKHPTLGVFLSPHFSQVWVWLNVSLSDWW